MTTVTTVTTVTTDTRLVVVTCRMSASVYRGQVASPHTLTLVTLGDPAVGKTSLINRFCSDTFNEVRNSVGWEQNRFTQLYIYQASKTNMITFTWPAACLQILFSN